MFNIFMYTFLAIFVATAVLTLLALPGWVTLETEFRRKLFYSLLLEVVGCVIGFVWVGVRLEKNKAEPQRISEEMLLSGEKWNWQYSARNWLTEAGFKREKDALSFSAITYYKREAAGVLVTTPIFVWKNKEPIEIPLDGRQLVIKCVKTVLPAAKEVYKGERGNPGDGPDAGECEVTITLRPDFAMTGVWVDEIPANPSRGGILLVRGK